MITSSSISTSWLSGSLNYRLIAGSYVNIPLIAQSVNPSKLQALQTRVEQTQAILESNDQTQLQSLTRDQILGDLFYAGGLGYYAQSLGLGQIAAQQARGSQRLEIGFGSFGYEPNVDTFFGVPRAITAGGIALNMLFIHAAQSHEGDQEQTAALRFQIGLASSALEHTVPEQIFVNSNNLTQGFSTVRALELAAQQGQRIYQINQDNINSVLPQLRLDQDVESAIRNAVQVGREAITHTDNVQVPGFSGSGYIIMDPETGAASYNISGGGNGGFIQLVLSLLLFLNAFLISIGAAVLPPVLVVLVITTIVALAFANTLNSLEGCYGNYGTGFAILSSILSFSRFMDVTASLLRVVFAGIIVSGAPEAAEQAVCSFQR